MYIASQFRNGIGYNTAMISGLTRTQVISLALIVFIGVGVLGAASSILVSAFRAGPTVQVLALTPTISLTRQAAPTLVSTSVEVLEPTANEVVLPIGTPDPLACLPDPGQAEEGRAAAVLEDAGIQVELAGKTAEVRLIGVDPAGSSAQVMALLRELVEGKTLRLLRDGQDADAQGNLLRYVLVGETFVNFEMVRRGAALPALYPPRMACMESFLAAGQRARAEGKGYWSLQPDLPGGLLPVPTASASEQPCDCAQTYACTDFKTRSAAQACYNACGDYRNTTLDPDHNGQACEALP